MLSPFPGMNPYLEDSGIGPSVHKRLIVAIADVLNPQLRPHYRVEIEERVYESGDESLLVGIPDNVVVQNQQISDPVPSSLAIAATLVEPVTVTLPIPEVVREWYLQVRQINTGEVVTVIEILSPKNKRAGQGRQQYLEKRQKILASATHLIEIDLLRREQPMPMEADLQSDYRILVSRSQERPQATLYPFNLPDKIPAFVLPLLPSSQETKEDGVQRVEPLVDLQQLLHEVYQRGSYDLVIDYSQEPTPPLSKVEQSWAEALLQEQGLR